jgi:acyl-CoA reductase-like NAD-dependent aldehyde dehydrogenase
VHSIIHEKVTEGLDKLVNSLKVGVGMEDPGNDLGPVINQSQMKRIFGFVQRAKDEGTECWPVELKMTETVGSFFLQSLDV